MILHPILSMARIGVLLVCVGWFVPVSAKAAATTVTDSMRPRAVIREVYTSQQLFVVEIKPVPVKTGKPKKAQFRSELRDAFMVIEHSQQRTDTALNWTMCPDGKCPERGLYKPGTQQFKQLDVLINQARTKPQKP